MRPLPLAALLLPLLSCAAPAAQNYRGTLSGCGDPTAVLTIEAGRAAFAVNEGVLVLRGTSNPDTTFTATLNTAAQGKPPFVLKAEGKAANGVAQVTYITPRCTAHGSLLAF